MHQIWLENKNQAQKSMVTLQVSVLVVGYAADIVWAPAVEGRNQEVPPVFRDV